MIEIISSSSTRFRVGTNGGIKTTVWGKPETLFIMVKMFKHEHIDFRSLAVEVLDEEKTKSFLGAAGIGLVGAAVLGPLGLVAGALAGGNKNTGVFGLTFSLERQEIKLVIKTSSKKEIAFFKEKSFATKVS